jgi:hypothetical protein
MNIVFNRPRLAGFWGEKDSEVVGELSDPPIEVSPGVV